MSFSVNTSAMTANLHASLRNQNVNSSLSNLASGAQINSAADDASGLTIANKLSAQVSGLGQSIQNANNGIGMLQVADGAMSGIQENMDRIRVLTLKASSGIMNAGNRESIQKEIDGLLKSVDGIAAQTTYNGMKLLDGNSSDAKFSSLSGSIDVRSETGITAALDTIESVMEGISSTRIDLGAQQNQLMANIRNTSVTQVNTASAESQIRDVDFAAESANFSQQNIMSQIGSFAQSQANAQTSSVARLFS